MNQQGSGMVYLVGGGPGDPGLITVRALECLRQAEVVIHDRLVNRCLLDCAPLAEWIDVGKRPDHHPVPQDRINALLVEKALQGKVVVRLKGGDPFVFGRGGEEAAVLAAYGLPFEIVPGVTSAVAAPAYAGIPITYRGLACSAVIVTGHRADCGEDPSAAWLRAAQGADTLVFLMGVQNLPRIVEQALAGGRNPATPVAIVQQGTTSAQKTIVGTLETIVELAAGVHPPAIIVIGEVVSKRDELRWFDHPDRRPLLGLGVLNTRPVREPCSIDPLSPFKREEFSQALMSLGAEPFEFPAYRLATAPLPDKFQPGRETHPNGNPKLPCDWIILSSPRAVVDFFESLIQSGCDARQLAGVKLAVVGEPAREALLQKGLAADYVFSDSSPAALAQSPGCFSGSRLFIPMDPPMDHSLLSRLRACGAQVESAGLYQSQQLEPDPGVISALLAEKIEVAAFFSPEDLDAVMNQLAGRGLERVFHNLTAACAGIETAQAAQQAGLKPEIIAQNATVEGMIEEIRRWRKP